MALRGRRNEFNCPYDYVQMDGLVVMKIIKHCYEERSNIDTPRGGLLGLVIENRLELTNTFPFPFTKAGEEAVDEEYTSAMMMHMKKINQDYLHVGWYQACELGSFVTTEFVLAQQGYQDSIEESIVVIYDPQKTDKGFLTIKAYRLTPQALKLLAENENTITPELVKSLHLSYERLFHEVPVVIRNSPLANALCCTMSEMKPAKATQFLDLGTASVMERHMHSLLEKVDELHQEAYKMNKWQMQVSKQQQEKAKYIHQRNMENATRQAKGETALPEEDLAKIFRPIPPPSRLPPMLASGQIEMSCQQVNSFCSQALAKLFISESLQESKTDA
ncbi:Eukaryotic translation initiation factor 3 subunit H [Orchesella cincta]|uniref:Eukaryotic translation initiation factor 3 subunit H n=1 Tax=Orchesella cincta TaxID=48709 RepID=A0A1D2NCZ1_ORCCI|nr:Eukaryotic translation initiation factor 3 subunit H [Orchesella cincta]